MLYLFVCLFLLCHLDPDVLGNSSVIIIGAGPAGIAAATKLLRNSFDNITILEAEDRIGGRINSIKFGNGIVDLGAQYCHGQKGNVAYELAKDFNILEPGLRSLQNNVYYSNGSRLDASIILELYEVYVKHDKVENTSYNTTDRSLGDLFIYKYNSTLLEKYKNDKTTLKILREGLRFLEGYIVIHQGSFSWFDPSAECNYKQCEGNQALIWKKVGYGAVLDIMMKSYPNLNQKLPIDDKIQFNTSVEKIIWNDTDSITVIASDNRTFSADYVIFTPSIGVLKRQKDTLFDPPLPPSKQEAIEATGFGGVMKIFLHFSTKWWKNEDQAFSFFWSDEDLKTVTFPDGPTKHGVSWVTQFRYVLKVPDNPNVWVGWISGSLVPQIEKLPLETLRSGCEYVLDKFLARSYNITKISHIMRSTWCTNKNFGGTYSYTRNGFYRKGFSYQEKLAEPLHGIQNRPVLLFAGEATNPVHYSTVHGAIETGYREAERIIHLQSRTNT